MRVNYRKPPQVRRSARAASSRQQPARVANPRQEGSAVASLTGAMQGAQERSIMAPASPTAGRGMAGLVRGGVAQRNQTPTVTPVAPVGSVTAPASGGTIGKALTGSTGFRTRRS